MMTTLLIMTLRFIISKVLGTWLPWPLHVSRDSYTWVMSPIYESCLLYMNHISYTWVMTPAHESCLLLIWVMSPIYESCLLYMNHVSYTWVRSPTHESWLIYMSHDSYIWVMSPTHESWLLYTSLPKPLHPWLLLALLYNDSVEKRPTNIRKETCVWVLKSGHTNWSTPDRRCLQCYLGVM